jgi:hypothetical protein
MAKLKWHAYYFDSFDTRSPIARTAIIEAEDEDEAGKIAVAQMGRCLRVHVARPMWEAPSRSVRLPRHRAERSAVLFST